MLANVINLSVYQLSLPAVPAVLKQIVFLLYDFFQIALLRLPHGRAAVPVNGQPARGAPTKNKFSLLQRLICNC